MDDGIIRTKMKFNGEKMIELMFQKNLFTEAPNGYFDTHYERRRM